jgi:anionic cell wall polymer biosynthesis LytR-Cps2A-Psr (LCP) family protein/TM2 domain-containing membrane protein YozV
MSTNPSPAVAALLSFLFPGAGQIYAGETRKGLIWAIPMFVFVVAVIWILLGGQTAMLNLVSGENGPAKRLALLTLNVAFFLYLVAAMLDAYAVAQRARDGSFGSGRTSGLAPIVLAGLVSLAIVLHGLPEVYGYQAHVALTNIATGRPAVIPTFNPGTRPPATPTPLGTPTPEPSPTNSAGQTPDGSPDATPNGSGNPVETPGPKVCPPPVDLASWPAWAQDNRLNILVAGTDSRSDEGVSDNSLRTDTMLLLTVDIQECKAAMFSFPRNMCTPSISGSCGPVGSESRYPDFLRIPLSPENAGAYPNGIFPDMLNALWRRAGERGDAFQGSPGIGPDCAQQFDCERAWRALTGTIQEIAGVQIDGVVSVNLKGFTSLVDNLPEQCVAKDLRVQLGNKDCYGGIWINAPRAIHDDLYHTSQQERIEVDIPKGCHFFDSEMALAYSRSRHESSDYDRARRQQYVLQQMRKQLDPIALLPHIPTLLGVAQANLFMTFSDADIPYLADAASRVDAERIYRWDFSPNRVTQAGSMQGMRDKVGNIFGEPEPDPEQSNLGKCPPR